MSRLALSLMLGALLCGSVVAQADDLGLTGAVPTLHGPNATDCAAANSDYERYELGCPIVDRPIRSLTSAEPVPD